MKARQKVIVGACAALIAGSGVAITCELAPATREVARIPGITIAQPDGLSCEVYLPAAMDPAREHPLVYATSPSGHAHELLAVWREACDRFQWILVASNNFRNGPRSEREAALELETIALIRHTYRIDATRIYAAGISGAAMHAHDLVADHPEIFRGVVANTGMMPHHMPANDRFDGAHYPRDKVAVFLASPTDFRYGEMKEDRNLLEGLGWRVDWLEFAGGHTYAPPARYVEAAAWLMAQ